MSDRDRPEQAGQADRGARDDGVALEADRPRLGVIVAAVAGAVILLLSLLLAVTEYFQVRVEREIADKVLDRETPALGRMRAEEERKLGTYQWIDRKKGVVRIPVERAAELVVDEYAKPPAPASAPAVAPAPAPNRDVAPPVPGAAK